MSDYIELSARPKEPAEENSELIIAYLSEYPFDVFEFEDGLVKAHGLEDSCKDFIAEIEEKIKFFVNGSVGCRIIAKENWNALWEKNYFEPITIENQVHIRAEFHPPVSNIPHEIVIQPKMSFGTGHHATTQLMVSLMLDTEYGFLDGKILDMGSGTGVLAIVAEKLGAGAVDAVDIEEWCAENIAENSLVNACKSIQSYQGDVTFLHEKQDGMYTYILANIHLQVLLNDTAEYARVLAPNGCLFLSGFYEENLQILAENAWKNGLTLEKSKSMNAWCAAVFRKK